MRECHRVLASQRVEGWRSSSRSGRTAWCAAWAPATSSSPTTSPAAVQSAQGTYTVKAGDTLSGIAQTQLGDAQRWPEIANLNPDVASHPDLIHAGTILTLPATTTGPPHLYTVKAGDWSLAMGNPFSLATDFTPTVTLEVGMREQLAWLRARGV